MNFAVIIPTRDRPKFYDHCIEQLSAQTLKPAKVYVIYYPPDSEEIDLVQRIRIGLDCIKAEGIDLVFIMEDDDSYPVDYFMRFVPFFSGYEFFGDDHTTYYNLKNKTYNTWHHPGRSSLFTTGFKISALDKFEWPADNERFMDIKLWHYARTKKRKFIDTGAIGIKHSVGLCGGRGHQMTLKNKDSSLEFLSSKVSDTSLEFYKNLIHSFNGKMDRN